MMNLYTFFAKGTPITALSGQKVSLVVQDKKIIFENAFEERYKPLLDQLKAEIQGDLDKDFTFFIHKFNAIYLDS